jgi:hypothetical protein
MRFYRPVSIARLLTELGLSDPAVSHLCDTDRADFCVLLIDAGAGVA